MDKSNTCTDKHYSCIGEENTQLSLESPLVQPNHTHGKKEIEIMSCQSINSNDGSAFCVLLIIRGIINY